MRRPTAIDQAFEQMVVSGIGLFDEGSSIAGTLFGFWIQQEADPNEVSSGQYEGSIYIDALGLSRNVSVWDSNGQTRISKGNLRRSVATADGTLSATLQIPNKPKKGPQNETSIEFTSPHVGSGTSARAVVHLPRGLVHECF